MTYEKNTYASRLIIIIFFFCLNNLLMVYNVTSRFDFLRVPLQLMVIAMCILMGIRSRCIRKDGYLSIIFTVLFLMFYFGTQILFQSVNQSANGYSLLNNISNGIFALIVFLFFFGCRDYEKTINYEKVSVVVFLLICAMYLFFKINMPVTGFTTNIYHAQYVNSIYYVIFMLPFVLRSPQKYVFFAIAGICVLLSGKQGAFIAFVLGFILFYISERKIHHRDLGIKLLVALSIAFVLSVFAYQFAVSRFNIDILSGFQSISEDGGNGRLDIYLRLFTLIKNSSIGEVLFGHGGLNAVANTLGISAHNDFLEILYDFGAIPLFVYIIFIFKMVKVNLELLKNNHSLAPSMIYTMCAFITLSMLSHLIFVLKYSLLLMAFLGITISELRSTGEKQ